MRVKMLALSVGADHMYEPGKVYEVDDVKGDALASLGYAEIIFNSKGADGDAEQKSADGKRTRKPRAGKAKS